MITTDTTSEFGTTVAKDLRTVMQGKVAIAGEASYEAAGPSERGSFGREIKLPRRCAHLDSLIASLE